MWWWVLNATPRPLYPLSPGKRPDTHCVRGWVGPRAGLGRCGKLSLPPVRYPDRPARSESLYRLSYPGPHMLNNTQQYSVDCSRGFNFSYLLSRAIINTRRRIVTEIITQRRQWVPIIWLPLGRTGAQRIINLRSQAINLKSKTLMI
jgi:hypothetical protein